MRAIMWQIEKKVRWYAMNMYGAFFIPHFLIHLPWNFIPEKYVYRVK